MSDVLISDADVARAAARQRGRRRLSSDEVRYVLESAPSTTTRAMAARLHIKWETLSARLSEMGVEAAPGRDEWSDEDVARLRRLADAGWSQGRLADELGRTSNAVRMAARRYDVEIYQPGRPWTADDKDYLRRYYGRVALASVARNLHRDEESVVQQAHKMRLGAVYGSSEDIPLADFIRATGISRDRILGTLVPRDGFPLVRRCYGLRRKYYFVDFERILPWMEAHQDLFDASRVEDGFFVEPPWLREKRRRDLDDNSYLSWDVRRSYWSEREVSTAWTLYGLGRSVEEIAERVGRSPGAVAARLATPRGDGFGARRGDDEEVNDE